MNFNKLKEIILKNNLAINTVYDIGACRGYWTENYLKTVDNEADIYLFEANPFCEPFLKEYNYFIKLLSSEDNLLIKYNINSEIDTGESYYKEKTEFYKNSKEILLYSHTLETICLEYNIPKPDLMKLDTQGSELDILKGSINIWKNSKLLILEVPLIEYNLNSPNIQEILDFLKKHKFLPFKVLNELFSEDYLVQLDLVFINQEVKAQYVSQTNYLII